MDVPMIDANSLSVAVVGLGYVGLPLAVEFGKRFKTFGYDLSPTKISAYQRKLDPAGEVAQVDLESAVHLSFSTDPRMIAKANVIIIAVPTPVDPARVPDLSALVSASKT